MKMGVSEVVALPSKVCRSLDENDVPAFNDTSGGRVVDSVALTASTVSNYELGQPRSGFDVCRPIRLSIFRVRP